MSEPCRRLRPVYVDPWQRLGRHYPAVAVRYADLGMDWGRALWLDGRPMEIVMHQRLTQVQRRVTLAHELEHLDRGAPCDTLRATIERRVLDATARYLLPDLDLVARTVAVYDLHRAAHELWVTVPVLIDRLRGLSVSELDQVIAHRESVA